MKYLILLFLFSCGMKHKLDGQASVNVNGLDKPIRVIHEIAVNEDLFIESCEQKYSEQANEPDYQDKVDKCVDDKIRIVSQLINGLNNQPNNN